MNVRDARKRLVPHAICVLPVEHRPVPELEAARSSSETPHYEQLAKLTPPESPCPPKTPPAINRSTPRRRHCRRRFTNAVCTHDSRLHTADFILTHF